MDQMDHRVVLTYPPEEHGIHRGILGDLAHIRFLNDVPQKDRSDTLRRADIIISRSFSSEEIPRDEILSLTTTQFIQLIFSGADNVPFADLPPHVVVATNTGAFAEPVAEHVLAMLLSLAKSLRQKHDLLARGGFDQSGLNRLLRGGICGIIGFGGNGRATARIMKGIGMRIYAVNRSGETNVPVDFIGRADALKIVLEASDVVVLTVPLTRETRNLITQKELAWMKRDAILINVARGAVIDQADLYRHMKGNSTFLVGIDTWWSEPSSHGTFCLAYPFFELPNLIGSPHIADHVEGMSPKATEQALRNVRNYLLGKQVRGVVERRDYAP